MKKIRETDKERADRLERQMDRLKFKQKKQLEKLDAEITRLNNHLNRGRELLHRVTSEIGTKQNERDLAVTRADALHKLLIATVEAVVGDRAASIYVPVEKMKSAADRLKIDVKTEKKTYILSLLEVQKEAETDGETEQAMVSASGQENEPSGDSKEIRANEAESLQGDKGAPD